MSRDFTRFPDPRAAFCALWLLGVGGVIQAAPIPYSMEHSFFSPSTARQTATQLGYSTAVDGGILVVGSPFDNTGGEDSGIAAVYNTATGALLHTLIHPSPETESLFGWSVAVSGNLIVVGVPESDAGAEDTGIACVYDLGSPTPAIPVAVLENPHPEENDFFGWSVSISGTRVVIGAPNGNSEVADAGCAYVYDLASATPESPVEELQNPDPAGQNFGYAVAVAGQRLVVGRPQTAESGDSSRAFIYDLSLPDPETSMLTLLDGTPATNEQFGWAVAVSGTNVVVSAPQEDTGAENAGAVYVYDTGSGSPTVPVATVHNPAPLLGDAFGGSVAVSGSRLAVGNHLDDQGGADSGRIYVFDLSSGPPLGAPLIVENPGPQSGDRFGRSVSLSGSRLATGADGDNTGGSDMGSAYHFDLSSGSPATPTLSLNTPSPSSDEEFGTSVAISGSIVAVGAHHDDKGSSTNSGTVFIYDFQSGDPAQAILTLDNPVPATNDYFGAAVAIAGNTVVVAAYQDDVAVSNSGTVYVFDRGSPTPTVPIRTIPNPSPQAQDQFGNALALSGTLLVVGAAKNDVAGQLDAGSAYVFDLSSPTPTVPLAILDNPAPAADDQFGFSVAISGTKVVVGAYGNDVSSLNNAGSAYVYDISSPTPAVPIATLDHPAPALDDRFGHAVAISGNYVVTGCYLSDAGENDAGKAFVYNLTSPTPQAPALVLNHPAPESEDYFGYAVAISGTRLVIGAAEADFGADDAGNAYVYELTSAEPSVPSDDLAHPGLQAGDLFGSSVAIDGTNIVAGAPLDDGNTFNRGAAYVFDPDPPVPQLQVEQPPGTGLIAGAASIQLGNATVGLQGTPQTVVLRNIGTSPLELTDIALVSGHVGDFSLNPVSLPATVNVDQFVTFEVSFTPGTVGESLATLRILSTAVQANPFDIQVSGQSVSPLNDSDGDGLNDSVELELEALGFNWQVNDEELLTVLRDGANASGLFTAPQLQVLHPGTPLLPVDPVSREFQMTLSIKTAVDLMDFELFPILPGQATVNPLGRLEFNFTTVAPKAFYLLEPR